MGRDGEVKLEGWVNIGGGGPLVGNGVRHKESIGGRNAGGGIQEGGGSPLRGKTREKSVGGKTVSCKRGGGTKQKGESGESGGTRVEPPEGDVKSGDGRQHRGRGSQWQRRKGGHLHRRRHRSGRGVGGAWGRHQEWRRNGQSGGQKVAH